MDRHIFLSALVLVVGGTATSAQADTWGMFTAKAANGKSMQFSLQNSETTDTKFVDVTLMSTLAEIDVLSLGGGKPYPQDERCVFEWLNPHAKSSSIFQYRFSCPKTTRFELAGSVYVGKQTASGKVVMKCTVGCPQNPYVRLEYVADGQEQ